MKKPRKLENHPTNECAMKRIYSEKYIYMMCSIIIKKRNNSYPLAVAA